MSHAGAIVLNMAPSSEADHGVDRGYCAADFVAELRELGPPRMPPGTTPTVARRSPPHYPGRHLLRAFLPWISYLAFSIRMACIRPPFARGVYLRFPPIDPQHLPAGARLNGSAGYPFCRGV
jgi:hypothetical protein